MTSKTSIGLLTFPIGKTGYVPVSNFIEVLRTLSDDLCLVTGNEGFAHFAADSRIRVHGVIHVQGGNPLSRILAYLITQLRISLLLAKETARTWIFFIGGDTLLMPLLVSKILRRRVILAFAGSSAQTLESAGDNLHRPMELISKLSCALSDRVVLHSPSLIHEWQMERYMGKTRFAHEYFVDPKKFAPRNRLRSLPKVVGHIGRLSSEKGSRNFAEAIPLVLQRREDVRFLIGGEGALGTGIKEYLESIGLSGDAQYLGWIEHDELPFVLNSLELLVIPSYTESGPVIAIEAMACGTPILISPVGQIASFVEDGMNGFILEDNSAKSIAQGILRVLENQDLDDVSKNARALVTREFGFEKAVQLWTEVLGS